MISTTTVAFLLFLVTFSIELTSDSKSFSVALFCMTWMMADFKDFAISNFEFQARAVTQQQTLLSSLVFCSADYSIY